MDVFTFSLSENNELIRTDNLPGINSGSKDYYSASVNGLISGTTSAVAYLTVSWNPGSKYGVPMAVSGTNGTFTIGEFFSSIPSVMNEYVDYHIGVSVVGYIGETRYTTNIVDIPIIKSNYSASTDAPSLTQNQYDAFVDDVSGYATAAANSAAAAANSAASMRMKLIRQITTTEAVNSVVISTDEEGNAISLDRFCLFLSFPSPTNPGELSVYCNNGQTSGYCAYYWLPGSIKHARFDGECMRDTSENSTVRHWYTNTSTGSTNSYGNQVLSGRYMADVPYVTSLRINGALPSGAVLVLYGRTT